MKVGYSDPIMLYGKIIA